MRRILVALLLVALTGNTSTMMGGYPEESRFAAENDAAMAKMMKAMYTAPTGDADRDFLLLMLPHHQGAVDIARAQIRYGTDPRLKDFSHRIIAAHEAEIGYARDARRHRSDGKGV